MEDILASIRRIIADDQSRHATATLQRRAALPVAPPRAPAAPPSRPDPGLTRAAAPSPAPAPPTPTSRPSSPPPPSTSSALSPAPTPPVPPARGSNGYDRPLASDGAPIVVATDPVVARSGPAMNGVVPHLNPPPIPPAMFDRALIDEIASAGVASALLEATALPEVPVAPSPETIVPDVAPSVVAEVAVENREPALEDEAPVEVEHQAVMEEDAAANAAPASLPLDADDPVPPTAAAEEPVVNEMPSAAASSDQATAGGAAPAAATGDEPLISVSADAMIESSFQALATSVFLQNTGVMEGMVRDMLRPLLKTWLEDNLPTIVERLVRAEIERVARGGRA